jgi:hypothetical protein
MTRLLSLLVAVLLIGFALAKPASACTHETPTPVSVEAERAGGPVPCPDHPAGSHEQADACCTFGVCLPLVNLAVVAFGFPAFAGEPVPGPAFAALPVTLAPPVPPPRG